jgi:hypothetical protein
MHSRRMEDVDLDLLITRTRVASASEEPLDQLSTARLMRDGLVETAEAMLDHFVDEARQAGCSWTQIGEALRVSKQAAQQRAAAPTTVVRGLISRVRSAFSASQGRGPFGRTSEESREVILRARTAALELQHPRIGTGHLLLGLVAAADGVVRDNVLAAGVHAAAVRAALQSLEEVTSAAGRLTFSANAGKAMELALRESLRLGSEELRPEHILLALLRERRNTAGEILRGLGADHRRMHANIEEQLARAG